MLHLTNISRKITEFIIIDCVSKEELLLPLPRYCHVPSLSYFLSYA
uniref:Uncharacterized protein n=1 Tax=Arundo donax TaxID=35708 RepID=A0A0A9CJ74_ARUDO